jgi:predicted phosphoserine aminotransferase
MEVKMTKLFVPGPVNVSREVLEAMIQPMIPHRTPEFEEIFHRAEGNARKLFKTQYRVFINASTGTSFHEAAMRNLIENKVLVCINGAFGERLAEVAELNGKKVDVINEGWDKPILPEMVAKALDGNKYDAVFVVHNETSTGILNPVAEISKVVHDMSPDTLFLVDTVSSIGGSEFKMDEWSVDLALTSSQKCLAMQPGLSLCAVSDRAMEKAATVKNRGWYLNFSKMEKHRTTNSTHATPIIGLIYALDFQLQRILDAGIENRYARHTAMAKMTREWVENNSQLSLYAPEGYRSNTVTSVEHGGKVDFKDLSKFLLSNDMRIANGYTKIKPHTMRFGHMGELTTDDISELLAVLDKYFS